MATIVKRPGVGSPSVHSRPVATSAPGILWVVGPALGHVSRALVVARRLRRDQGVESLFCGRDRHGHHAELLGEEFSHQDLGEADGAETDFADAVRRVLDRSRAAVVGLDCSPLPWLVALGDLPVPVAYLTNWFLTPLGRSTTEQDVIWSKRCGAWQSARRRRGLTPLNSARELYERDLVLLADPPALVPPAVSLPPSYRLVGPCSWESGAEPSVSLDHLASVLLLSFGSTGQRPLPSGLVAALAGALEPDAVLAVGPLQVDEPLPNLLHCERLRLSAILPRCRLVLTHGGTGTAYRALASGVPVCCWPAHRNHALLADRISQLGMGLTLDADRWRSQIPKLIAGLGAMAERARTCIDPTFDGPGNAARVLSAVTRS